MLELNANKSFDLENSNSIEKKCFNATNYYGINYEAVKKSLIDYDKICKKVTYNRVKNSNIKGKR